MSTPTPTHGVIYARVTDQGTAAGETAVCRLHLEQSPTTDDAAGPVVDCTGNDELACVVCGRTTKPVPPGRTRITVATHCAATLREEWTLDLTDAQLAAVRKAPGQALDLISDGNVDGEETDPLVFVGVTDVGVDDEHDRFLSRVWIGVDEVKVDETAVGA